jgi:uncharacterized protein YjbI with pentapeptide repeats
MKIKTAELLAKISSGQILPGICKKIETNNQPIEPSDDDMNKPADEKTKIIEDRLFNKKYQNIIFVPKNEKIFMDNNCVKTEEEFRHKIENFIIKSREPKSTILAHGQHVDFIEDTTSQLILINSILEKSIHIDNINSTQYNNTTNNNLTYKNENSNQENQMLCNQHTNSTNHTQNLQNINSSPSIIDLKNIELSNDLIIRKSLDINIETDNYNEVKKSVKHELLDNENNLLDHNDFIDVYSDIIIPTPKEKFAYEIKDGIILNGVNIILGINRYGLIGTNSIIPTEISNKYNNNYMGIKYKQQKNNYFEYMPPLFIKLNQTLNFNCIKVVYSTDVSKIKIVTNTNLYNNLITPVNNLSIKLPNNYEFLIPIKHSDVCADNILATETDLMSSDLEHRIRYSFTKYDNKISINVILTNRSNQTLNDVKYYYAANLRVSKNTDITDVSRFKTSPYETAIYCGAKSNTLTNHQGIYMRTKQNNSFVFSDNHWDWLYDDKWDIIKLTNANPIDIEDVAISGLAFNKKKLQPNSSWSINFCIGFTNEKDFIGLNFLQNTTGLNLRDNDFSNMQLNGIITNSADFTNCILTNADLSKNSLFGAKTGPLAESSGPPKRLPPGYKFVISNSSHGKYIVGPNVVLINCDLCESNLSNLDLSNCNFYGSNLSRSIFNNANLTNIIFSKNTSHNNNTIKIPGYIVSNGLIIGPGLNYTNLDLSYMDLTNGNFTNSKFINCDFSHAILSNCNFTNCDFTNIKPGPFIKNDINNVILPKDYKFVNLENEHVFIAGPKVNLSEFDLSNTNLSHINLSNVNFTLANVSGTDMTSTIIDNAITGPLLCYTEVIGLSKTFKCVIHNFSDYRYIIGPGVSLVAKDLSEFDLTNVNLSGGNFIFSTFTSANLSNTDLQNAHLPCTIGPLVNKKNPKNFENTMSLEILNGDKWLVYKWDKYKWDVYLRQLKGITS